MMPERVLALGMGYTARAAVPLLKQKGWQISGSTRSAAKVPDLQKLGVTPFLWSGSEGLGELFHQIDTHQVLVVSAAPQEGTCPVLTALLTARPRCEAAQLEQVIYLSSTGVYGDHQGQWIDETALLKATSGRGQARISAEQGWRSWCGARGIKFTVLRLAGIYGPGRNAVESLADEARRATNSISGQRVYKEGHVFNRIHVQDVARIIVAAIDSQDSFDVTYNVCDDKPSPPQDVVAYAAELLGMKPPPLIPIEEADLSPMARSFYADNKRLRNTRLKEQLGIMLTYPDYQTGLHSLHRSFIEHQ